jgi:thiamine-phosphate pyrophosphorylase
MTLPRLYAINDSGCFASAPDPNSAMTAYARELLAGGVTLIQYRNKGGSAREMLAQARELRRVVASATAGAAAATQAENVRLIMNDRADLCLAADFGGVHVGQDDLSPMSVRAIVGAHRWVGVSTHNPAQVREADTWPVDYIAVGPVFATTSKLNPDPVIGLEGVRLARSLTKKPLVAIGGITRANCRDVIAAGADSIAVISDLLKNPRQAARDYLSLLKELSA